MQIDNYKKGIQCHCKEKLRTQQTNQRLGVFMWTIEHELIDVINVACFQVKWFSEQQQHFIYLELLRAH